MRPPPATPGRDAEAGVTLVEMLVALAIFALVGLASFAVLDAVIRTRDRTEGRLERVAEIDRALFLFGRDLLQGDAGATTLADGVLAFGLRGAGGPAVMSYTFVDGVLERRVGGPDGSGPRQRLLPGLAAARFRGLDASGAWHDAWPPEAAEGGGDEAPALVGVEMVLALAEGEGAPTVRRLVPLARVAEPPPGLLGATPAEAAAP